MSDYKLVPGHYSFKQPSEAWFNEFYKGDVTILDPDGWDRTPDGWEYSWSKELITRTEFERRLCQSTIMWKTGKL